MSLCTWGTELNHICLTAGFHGIILFASHHTVLDLEISTGELPLNPDDKDAQSYKALAAHQTGLPHGFAAPLVAPRDTPTKRKI